MDYLKNKITSKIRVKTNHTSAKQGVRRCHPYSVNQSRSSDKVTDVYHKRLSDITLPADIHFSPFNVNCDCGDSAKLPQPLSDRPIGLQDITNRMLAATLPRLGHTSATVHPDTALCSNEKLAQPDSPSCGDIAEEQEGVVIENVNRLETPVEQSEFGSNEVQSVVMDRTRCGSRRLTSTSLKSKSSPNMKRVQRSSSLKASAQNFLQRFAWKGRSGRGSKSKTARSTPNRLESSVFYDKPITALDGCENEGMMEIEPSTPPQSISRTTLPTQLLKSPDWIRTRSNTLPANGLPSEFNRRIVTDGDILCSGSDAKLESIRRNNRKQVILTPPTPFKDLRIASQTDCADLKSKLQFLDSPANTEMANDTYSTNETEKPAPSTNRISDLLSTTNQMSEVNLVDDNVEGESRISTNQMVESQTAPDPDYVATPPVLTKHAESSRKISVDLKIEIERSLLGRTLHASESTQTLPPRLDVTLHRDTRRSSRPLSWTGAVSESGTPGTSKFTSKFELRRSASVVEELLEEDMFVSATDLPKTIFDKSTSDSNPSPRQMNRDRRLSQPHFVKSRRRNCRLTPIVGSPTNSPTRFMERRRRHVRSHSYPVTRSGPGRDTAPQTARLRAAIADPLFHHVTHEVDELAFQVGDVIMVLDQSDRDWWLGRLASPSDDSVSAGDRLSLLAGVDRKDGECGYFPAAFVRLRANQDGIEEGFESTVIAEPHVTSNGIEVPGIVVASPSIIDLKLAAENRSCKDWQPKRCNVVKEILCAEKDYVDLLENIVEGFVRNARSRADMFTQGRVDSIFGNIEELYELSREFLSHLQSSTAPFKGRLYDASIGASFIKQKDKFRIYSVYCNNHPKSMAELTSLQRREKYMHFFEGCRLLRNMIKLPLDGFLLTPIQKICKYHLQLQELLKYTPVEHVDRIPLEEALSVMKHTAAEINERKRKIESIQKIHAWQMEVEDWQGPPIISTCSEMVHSGELSKISSSGRLVDRYFFLFDHLLVQCKKELIGKNLIYKSRYELDAVTLNSPDTSSKSNSSNRCTVELKQGDRTVLSLSSKSAEERDKWMKAFHRERKITKLDQESGFRVDEDLMNAIQLNPQTSSKSKPSKQPNNRTQTLSRRGSDFSLTSERLDSNSNSLGKKQRDGNILARLRRKPTITTTP